MYRCQFCRCVVPPRTPCQRVILQTRVVESPYRSRANRFVRIEKGKPKTFFADDPGGSGVEIVHEIVACPRCAAARSANGV
jgi:hypothetical protein